jgi:hypothetical protein
MERRTVHGEALPVIPTGVLGQEVLEVLVGIIDVADLVNVVDEVSGQVSERMVSG